MGTLLEGGHTEAVLCTAVSAEGHVISGGEGGQLCIWSLDGSAPQKHTISETCDDVTSVCCSHRKPHEIFLACGRKVHKYDLRDMSKPCFTLEENEDEVNQVVLHEKEDYLAACDDSGHIKVFYLPDKRVYKTLRKHTNICVCLAFRPRRPWDLLSAGFDYQLLQWDFSRGRSVCNIDMQEVGLDEPLPSAYMVSPPFVYSMSISRTGNQVACGTENALVQLFDSSKRTLTFVASLRGHSSGVSQVHFLPSSEHTLVTGGNDGKIYIWDTRLCSQHGPAENGVANGVQNGVHNGVSNGVANGIQNGVANGFHNGVGNGIHNGVANGIHNGIANGIHNGIANGIHNGVANGVANGIPNGVVNGFPNGIPNGVMNGAPNAAQNGAPAAAAHALPIEEVVVNEALNEAQNATKHPALRRPRLQPKLHITHGHKINWLSSVSKNGQVILIVADSSSNITLYNLPEWVLILYSAEHTVT